MSDGELKYEPKLFRQWLGEGKPDPKEYLFKNKSTLISTPVFCEIMAERLKEFTYVHCGKTMIPDGKGGLIDTPIDSARIKMWCKTWHLGAERFCFHLGEFPINRPADWTNGVANNRDETGRLPDEQAWAIKKHRNEYSQTYIQRTKDQNGDLIAVSSWFAEGNISTTTDRKRGEDEVKEKHVQKLKQVFEDIPNNRTLTSEWIYEDGEEIARHQVVNGGAVEWVDGRNPSWQNWFAQWVPFSAAGAVTNEVRDEEWNSDRPRVFWKRSQALESQELTFESFQEVGHEFLSKWSINGLFDAMKARIKQLGTISETLRASDGSSVAWFAGKSGGGMPDELHLMEYGQSIIAPWLEARYDDGDFKVTRVLIWRGCDDTDRARSDFDERKKQQLVEDQFDVLSWLYEGSGQVGKPIPPLYLVEPFGFGVMWLQDLLAGVANKITQGVR